MCGGRYAGFSRCAVSDIWDSADVRSQICGFSTDVCQRVSKTGCRLLRLAKPQVGDLYKKSVRNKSELRYNEEKSQDEIVNVKSNLSSEL